ncbi:phage portal protein [Facklamia languida]
MGILDLFKRGAYRLTEESLTKITDHPKIAVTSEEYLRILDNLKYFKSDFKNVTYTNSDGQVRERGFSYLPMARTACKKIASLVYNEQAEIILEDEVANAFVTDVLNNDRFNKNFERFLESGLALGGLAMRPYVDGERIKVAFIQAPVFFPLRSNIQDVSESAIVTKTTVDKKYYTLIEFHEWQGDQYVITNELYESKDSERVGYRVPLSTIYEDMEERVTFNNLTRPLFTYLRTPGMNNKDINSSLGLSLYDNAKQTIDFINTTFDQFNWEVKMGQRRVAVPESTIKTIYTRNGEREIKQKHFDPDQNVFVQIGNPDIDKTISITDLTTPIRSNNYIDAINKGLALFEMQIGVSGGMFTFDGKSMKTATEVVSENSDTYQMRNSIVSLVEQSIKELIISICELAKACDLYDGIIPTMDSITINLDDGVFTDRQKELQYWSQALVAGLVSREYAMCKVLGVTEEEAQTMIHQINIDTTKRVNLTREGLDYMIYGE